MADKQELLLEEVLEKLGKKDPTKEGVFDSKEWILFEKMSKEKNFEHDDHFEILKEDAKTNKAFNAIQIGKEIWDMGRERTAKKFYEKQRKHNRGAFDSRRKIEAELAAIKELLDERIIKVLHGGGFGPEGYQETAGGQPTPPTPGPTTTTAAASTEDRKIKKDIEDIEKISAGIKNRVQAGHSRGPLSEPGAQAGAQEWSKEAFKKSGQDPNDPEVRKAWGEKNFGKNQHGWAPRKSPNEGNIKNLKQYKTPAHTVTSKAGDEWPVDSTQGKAIIAARKQKDADLGARKVTPIEISNIDRNWFGTAVEPWEEPHGDLGDPFGKNTTDTAKTIRKTVKGVDDVDMSKWGEDAGAVAGSMDWRRSERQFGASRAASIIGNKLSSGDDIESFLQDQPDVQAELKRVAETIAKVQRGDKNVDRDVLDKDIQRLNYVTKEAGEKKDIFGLKEVQRSVRGGTNENIFKKSIREWAGVSRGGFSKKAGGGFLTGMREMVQGKGGLFTSRKFVAGQEAKREILRDRQRQGFEGAVDQDAYPGMADPLGEKKKEEKATAEATKVADEETKDKVNELEGEAKVEETKQADALANEVEQTDAIEQIVEQDKARDRKDTAEKRTGQDNATIQEKQLEELIKIRNLLAIAGGGGGGGSMIPPIVPTGGGWRNKLKNSSLGQKVSRARLTRRMNKFAAKGTRYDPTRNRFVNSKGQIVKTPQGAKLPTNVQAGMKPTTVPKPTTTSKIPSGVTRAATGTAKVLSKVAAPLTVAVGAYDAYTGITDAEAGADEFDLEGFEEGPVADEETGEMSIDQSQASGGLMLEEEQARKWESGLGGGFGVGGAFAGAAIGSSIGAAAGLPFFGIGAGPGAFFGGLIGGAVGWWGGRKAGQIIGRQIADRLDISDGELAESNEQVNATMAQAEASGEAGQEIAANIEQIAAGIEANYLENMETDAPVSEKDAAVIKNASWIAAINSQGEALEGLGIEPGGAAVEWAKENNVDVTERLTMPGTETPNIKTTTSTDAQGLDPATTGPAIASVTTPTGAAIENMTAVSGGGQSTGGGVPVIVKGGDTTIVGGESGGMSLAVQANKVRTSDAVFQRFQNKRWS